MRIILCLNYDIMSNIFLNLMRDSLVRHNVKIFMSRNVGKKGGGIDELNLLEKSLPCDFIFPLLEQRGKPDVGCYYTFSQVEKYDGVEISFPENINGTKCLEEIKSYSPDLILSVRFGQIFKDEVISIPRHGIINLHSGILPNYKGILSTFQAMKSEEERVGCTLHYITDPTIDTGSIISHSYVNTNKERSLLWHLDEIYKGGAVLMRGAIEKIAAGEKIESFEQDLSQGKYFSLPTESDVKKFRELGYKLFDSFGYAELIRRYF